MPTKATKPSKSVKGPQIVTSMSDLVMATPKRATNQGGQMVGGMPVNFGVGKGAGKTSGKSKSKPSRKKMY